MEFIIYTFFVKKIAMREFSFISQVRSNIINYQFLCTKNTSYNYYFLLEITIYVLRFNNRALLVDSKSSGS